MDFALTEQQRQVRASLRAFLTARNPFSPRRAADGEPGGELWRALNDELGLPGALVPRSAGGLGGGPVDAMVIMEELGANLTAEPFLETAVVAVGLLTGGGGRDAELAEIASGRARHVPAWSEPGDRYRLSRVATCAERRGGGWRVRGRKSVVTGAPGASRLIVTARTAGNEDDARGVSLFLVDPAGPGVTVSGYPTIDGRRAAEVALDADLPADALLGGEGSALPLVEEAADRAAAASCAEAVGVLRELLRLTVEHAGARRQFGSALSEFQALQHRMADMLVQVEVARAAACLAALRLEADPATRARAVSAAKVAAGNALRFVGQNAVQLHGGSGMTEELPVGHYFRRATAIEGEHGSTAFHLARFAALGAAGDREAT